MTYLLTLLGSVAQVAQFGVCFAESLSSWSKRLLIKGRHGTRPLECGYMVPSSLSSVFLSLTQMQSLMACESEVAADSDTELGRRINIWGLWIDWLGIPRLNRLGATLTHEVTKDKCEILHFDSPQIPAQVLGGLVVGSWYNQFSWGPCCGLGCTPQCPPTRGGLSALCSDVLSNPTWSTCLTEGSTLERNLQTRVHVGEGAENTSGDLGLMVLAWSRGPWGL